ncbi:MAG: response regulator [Verrucomicrobia bacterium]|nr:response regulator [Verrucomicrobiota bacterium]
MKKILVIDDEAELREMMVAALHQRGFEVVEATNGITGVELARTETPDLILCDVNMDQMNGYATLSSLRNEPATNSIPFILMTGMADNSGMRHGMELGADDYLPKPFSITELYAAVEARLKKAQALREEAEKKLTDLRDNISLMLPHELRTPLNGILAYGEILSADAGMLPPGEIAEMGKTIHESGKRLERLIENFLIYTQVEVMATDSQRAVTLRMKRTVNAANVIKRCAEKQAEITGRPTDLALELTDGSVAISEEYLTKIIDELLINAFKFSKAGTRIRVTLGFSPGLATLTISDRGRGFSTEQITKVGAYMQFERKLHEQQGLGLGLAIAKRLTELHGGTLSIQSAQGAGTAVTVKLPTAHAS